MAKPTRARHTAAGDERLVDDDVHPWVAKARAIDAAAGGSDLNMEALARFVRILRVSTAGARRAGPSRKRPARGGRVGRAAPLRAG